MRFTNDHTAAQDRTGWPGLLFRLIALLGVVAVLATSCGGDDDEASGDAASASDTESAFASASEMAEEEADDDMADAEAGFDTSTDGSSDRDDGGFFAEEDDMSEEEADGGLFGDDEEDPDRLEDNTFEDYGVRPFVDTDVDNTSTFGLDVDTGSYVVTRRWINEGVLPPQEAVRVEEFVNFFDYDYSAPADGLRLHVDGGPSPFDDDNVLVRIGMQAAIIDDRDRPSAALTFVVDTSGSMDRDDRLGLVKEALRELVDELDDDDTVAIVTYGDDSAIILEPTRASAERTIVEAI
ncbi:MAG: von Willebrand factor type A domain-containing protein, partial [Actinomycetota bacterium]